MTIDLYDEHMNTSDQNISVWEWHGKNEKDVRENKM